MMMLYYRSNTSGRLRRPNIRSPDPGANGKMMFGLGVAELVLVLAVVLFVFGWGRLSQLGNHFRQAIRNFKQAAQGDGEIDVTPTTSDEPERKESRHVR